MFSNVDDLKNAIMKYDPRDFVSHFIFELVPYIFEHNLSAWISWKTQLAQALEVDPYDIVLTGSASIEYSLSPRKNLKKFDESSDIDCGIISGHHFDVAWKYLRNIQPKWLTLPQAAKRAIQSHRENYVFSGTIATDSMLSILPFGENWGKALTAMGQSDYTKYREVKLRIYKDYDALRNYQAFSIEKVRLSIASDDDATGHSSKDLEAIETED